MCDAHTGILLLFVSQELERQAAEAAAQAEKAALEADGQALQSIKAVHRTLQPPEFESLLSFQNLYRKTHLCRAVILLVLLINCHDE